MTIVTTDLVIVTALDMAMEKAMVLVPVMVTGLVTDTVKDSGMVMDAATEPEPAITKRTAIVAATTSTSGTEKASAVVTDRVPLQQRRKIKTT